MRKKVAVVGIGGRTGTLFADGLVNGAQVLGIGRESAVERIQNGMIHISKGEIVPYIFKCKMITEREFDKSINPDFILLATKNPVSAAVRYYYERVDPKHIPDLILSQNGFLAADEAYEELQRIFGDLVNKMRIFRVALFNAVSTEAHSDKYSISYSLPIRLSFGVAYGPDNVSGLKEIFDQSGIESYIVQQSDVRGMEYSKLFTNLIGTASFANGMSIEQGFNDKQVFADEINVLKEYMKVVRKSGGRFLNFKYYPIGLIAFLVDKLPVKMLGLFRRKIGSFISKERGGRAKGNIDEIDYYNGAIVKLGSKSGVETPINNKIYEMIKERL